MPRSSHWMWITYTLNKTLHLMYISIQHIYPSTFTPQLSIVWITRLVLRFSRNCLSCHDNNHRYEDTINRSFRKLYRCIHIHCVFPYFQRKSEVAWYQYNFLQGDWLWQVAWKALQKMTLLLIIGIWFPGAMCCYVCETHQVVTYLWFLFI